MEPNPGGPGLWDTYTFVDSTMATYNATTEHLVLDIPSDDGVASDISKVTPSHGEPIVTRSELWSYYLYFYGGAGVPIFSTLTIFQNLATLAGYDPTRGPGSSCFHPHPSRECVLPWGSGTKSVSSVVLLANGISFAMITIILTVIGPAADYGSLGRWSLFMATLIYWGSMFSTITLTSPSHWSSAMAIYIVGFTAYGVMLAFYSAIFPRLARNTRRMRELMEMYNQDRITVGVYEQAEALEKSRISNLSMASRALGFIMMLSLNLSLLIPFRGNRKANNYVVLLSTTFGLITGVWWFIFQQPRPGLKLPEGERYVTIGWKQIWTSLKQYKKLPNTFMYLFAYFLLADGLNTTTTLVQICQNIRFTFSFLENTYLGLVQAGTSLVGLVVYWYIQRYWKIEPKKMLITTNIVAVLLPLWGMIGIWTEKLGYHNGWEFWAHSIVFGLFQTPYFAYSQTLMAELSPPGFDFMFFGLFGLTNRASSIVGPNVIQAIIDKTGNTWQGFPFLFATCLASSLVIWFAVDMPKGRQDAERWAVEQRGTVYLVHPGRKG